MSKKRRKKTEPSDSSYDKQIASFVSGSDSAIPMAIFVSLIAHLTAKNQETPRMARDRVRHAVVYAMRKGEIRDVGLGDGKAVSQNEAFLWAKDYWKVAVQRLPAHLALTGTTSVRFSETASLHSLPNSLEECTRLLILAKAKIRELEAIVEEMKSKEVIMAPKAEKYDAIVQTNTSNAKRSRRNV